MYIPKHYLNENTAEAIEFMQKFNFASIITSKQDKPVATHIPFVVSKRKDKIILTSHFSKANSQGIYLESKNALVIFSEVHAYISTKFYDKKENVPTWNYVAVHAYGTPKIIDKEKDVLQVLKQMINSIDPDYFAQWESLEMAYKSRMIKGIIAFEIEVDEIQFKEKLSQNKTESEINRIREQFLKSDLPNERIIARYMNKK
jgi:transcriptional regulator